MMDLKKLAPWNWFKKEEEEVSTLPVRRSPGAARPGGERMPLTQLRDEFDSFFDSMLGEFGNWPLGGRRREADYLTSGVIKPCLDIAASKDSYTITVEIPGVEQKDVSLEVIDDTLTVRGEKRQEKEEKSQGYYRMERSFGSFQRILSLPADADQQSITATFRDGVLTVRMKRSGKPQGESRRIEIR